MSVLVLSVNGQPTEVTWEDNAATSELAALAAQGAITVKTSRYGGFEQVGALPANLPTKDRHLTSQAGDIFLYQGDQIVVFLGSNAWNYTKLGHITSPVGSDLKRLLDQNSATLKLELK